MKEKMTKCLLEAGVSKRSMGFLYLQDAAEIYEQGTQEEMQICHMVAERHDKKISTVRASIRRALSLIADTEWGEELGLKTSEYDWRRMTRVLEVLAS